MATFVFCCGFECGQLGTAGQHWPSPTGASISTTTVRPGSTRSLRINLSANSASVSSGNGTVAAAPLVARVYINFTTLPSASAMLIYTSVSGVPWGIGYKATDGKLYCGATNTPSFGTTGIAITTGVWYRIDLKVDKVAGTIDGQVDGVALSQFTQTASSGASSLSLGPGVNPVTTDIFFDDVAMSGTAADYPIGAGQVYAFVPVSDGTHTATGTNTVKGTAAVPVGAAITSATTDAYAWVNAVPIGGGATDATSLINQQTLLATEYTEVKFGAAPNVSPPSSAPRGVEVLVVDRQAATTVGDMHIKLNDNGTVSAVLDRTAAAGVITDRYTTKHYAVSPSTNPWNSGTSGFGAFNNIKMRFGYSADATPDQYWRGAMIEAEFAPASSPKLGLLGVG